VAVQYRLADAAVLTYRFAVMSIQQIEEAIKTLSTTEIETLRAWIEDYIEDEREVNAEFVASIERGKRDIAEGRTRNG
jgi:hypothetical protein